MSTKTDLLDDDERAQGILEWEKENRDFIAFCWRIIGAIEYDMTGEITGL